MQKIYHIGDIMRTWGEAFIEQYKPHLTVKKAIEAISLCRTPRLGGRQVICVCCGHIQELFNSCGNRNCPICQSIKKELWIDKTGQRLLSVCHAHVVFTLPHQLNPLFMCNMQQLYGLLFQSANATIQQLCADPQWLGARPGMLSVLHT